MRKPDTCLHSCGSRQFAFTLPVNDLRLGRKRWPSLQAKPARFGFGKRGQLRAQECVSPGRGRPCSLPSPEKVARLIGPHR